MTKVITAFSIQKVTKISKIFQQNYLFLLKNNSETAYRGSLTLFIDQKNYVAINQENLSGDAVARRLLTAESQIERAITELLRLETILDQVCQEVQSLGFEFVGLSLVIPEHNTIEAIRGCGQAEEWTNRAKHFLEQDSSTRDIQADIVQTCRTEVIAGWDKRFDRWIYKTFNHERLIRIFTPVVAVFDSSGDLRADWVQHCNWEATVSEVEEEGRYGYCVRHSMHLQNWLAEAKEPKINVLGTIEAGYLLSEQKALPGNISTLMEPVVQQVPRLIESVAQLAPTIWKAQLPYVLEVIAKRAKRILGADAATLHFLRRPDQPNQDQSYYIHQVASGEIGRQFLKEFSPPRKHGLGRKAIRSGKCEYIDNVEDLAASNPNAFAAGVRAIAAFPLKVDNQELLPLIDGIEGLRKEGVLYVVYQREHKFTRSQLRWGEIFAQRAVEAIRHATFFQQTRNRERQMETLQSITQSLIHIGEDDPLHQIAWNTLNILGADVVTIYEYIHSEGQFLTPPEVAGQLREAQKMDTKLDRDKVPFRLVQHDENIYASERSDYSIFQSSLFAQREGIESVAGILLKVDEREGDDERSIVGVMFVNYRRFHGFPIEERKLIEMLAASAAIAIKNQRRLYTFSDINLDELTVAPNQEDLLDLVVQKAVQITDANLGTVRLLDPSHHLLITKARYPKDLEINENRCRTSIEEGITGWVARTGQSELVNDVTADERYQSYFVSTKIGSELCVPLQNGNDLLGVLNVESPQVDAFNRRHLWMLKNLAYYASIAVQNVRNKERLVRMRTIATFNDLAGQLVHLTNNNVGALRTYAQRILKLNDPRTQENAQEILSLAEEILERAEAMSKWIEERGQRQLINPCHAIHSALNQVPIPLTVCQSLDLPDNLPQVLGGEQQLLSVFVNLAQNAIDAMPEGGTLHVSGECKQQGASEWIYICVRDTGVGIAEENMERIFQYGYSTRQEGRGMGFGLWWTKGYVEELGGYLTVESRLGEGTKLTVALPACNQKN